ncbi:MAG TPA: serine/threonine protein kinase [Bacteroidota bacterium]|nr:serine/threonine protein kinase [Bacteroidota bacterium]
MVKTKHCQYCGREIPLEAVICIHCKGALASKPGVAVVDHFGAVKHALAEKYEIVAEIGHGGNATVYQAIQKNLDRKIALKVLLPGLVNDPGYMERFHLEARAIAKLRHPNIVTIYDEGCMDGVHFIAMEFLDGKDLHHLVKEKTRLEIREAVAMATCIAGALDYAHSYGIVHRDVKSSNIIMTSSRTSVLTDFGIAQSGAVPAQPKSGSLLGTPEFMSPEQAGGKAVDARTDFYSLGVVLYHTLSGHYPFQGDSPITTIHKILYEKPAPLENFVTLPVEIKRVIEGCLERDPDKRVATGRELIELLKSVPLGTPSQKPVAARATTQRPAPSSADIAARRNTARQSDDAARQSDTAARRSGTGARQPDTSARQSDTAPRQSDTAARRSDTGARQSDTAARRVAPPSKELKPAARGAKKSRTGIRIAVIAAVVCMAITGVVAWHRVPPAPAAPPPEKEEQAALPERRLVPYLIGATKDEAIRLIRREGFEIGAIRAVAVPDSSARGKVDSQHPAHGSVAKPGTTVDILIGE